MSFKQAKELSKVVGFKKTWKLSPAFPGAFLGQFEKKKTEQQ